MEGVDRHPSRILCRKLVEDSLFNFAVHLFLLIHLFGADKNNIFILLLLNLYGSI